jgi:hypothetical protein
LPQYNHDIYDPDHNPAGRLAVTNHPLKAISSPIEFAVNFADYISPGAVLSVGGVPNPISVAPNAGDLTFQEMKNIIQALHREQVDFSNRITVRKMEAGEVFVRCCQNGACEPGGWWVKIQDMPLSIVNVRDGTAVKSEWNQNGNLEFFIVPEGCNIVVLEGRAALQQLTTSSYNNQKLPRGGHATLVGGRINLPLGCTDVNGQYLRGGTNQIAITGNWNGRPEAAFQPYMSCIAIIEAGFDVELDEVIFNGKRP